MGDSGGKYTAIHRTATDGCECPGLILGGNGPRHFFIHRKSLSETNRLDVSFVMDVSLYIYHATETVMSACFFSAETTKHYLNTAGKIGKNNRKY